MVLFKDEEEQIKAEERAKKPPRKWPIFVKILLVLILLTCGGLFIISKQEGNNETLHSSLEGFLTASTGMKATVGTLHNLAIFPNVKLDAEDISLADPKTGHSIIISKVNFKAPFFAMSASKLKFHHLALENINIGAGIVSETPIKVDFFGIKDFDEKMPELQFLGTNGADNFALHFGLKKTTKSHGRKIFTLADKGNLDFTYGNIKLSGYHDNELKKLFWNLHAHIEAEKKDLISPHNQDNQPKMAGQKSKHEEDLKPARNIVAEGVFMALSLPHVKGHIKTGHSTLEFDLKDPISDEMTGTISSPEFHMEDISSLLAIELLTRRKSTAKPDFPLSRQIVNLDISLPHIKFQSQYAGHLSAPLKLSSAGLYIAPIEGKLGGGPVTGAYNMETNSGKGKLDAALSIKKLNYAQFQKHITDPINEKANITLILKLNGEGDSMDSIMADLHGTMSLTAGKGHMRSSAFNLWTGGLLGAMLPGQKKDNETVLNCAFAHFDVKDGVATPSPFFIDTKQATIIGKGDINLAEQKINLKISPQLKDTALIDVSTPINVSGDLLAPSISPSAAGLGKVIGSVLLAAVNPATLLITMNDLGLSEDHPCRKYAQTSDASETPPPAPKEETANQEAKAAQEPMPQTDAKTTPIKEEPK